MKNPVKKIYERTPELIRTAYKHILVPEMVSRINLLIVTVINSVIVARFIGNTAVAAVTLCASLPLFVQTFSNLLVSGTNILMISYKSQGKTKQAARAFGAILINTFFCFALISLLSLFFIEGFFKLYTNDPQLLKDCMNYFYPMAIFEPFCEVGLALEKGLKTDGNVAFFGRRMIITNILNLLLNLFNVKILHGRLFAVSAFSYIAGLAGYLWSASYLLHKECAIRPDLSVIKTPAEMKPYIKEELHLGGPLTVGAAVTAISTAVFRKAIMNVSGERGMYAFGIFTYVINIFNMPSVAVRQALQALASMFYSEKDKTGTSLSAKTGILIELFIGIGFFVLLVAFTPLICTLYNVEIPEDLSSLKLYLIICTSSAVIVSLSNCFSSFFISVRKLLLAGCFSVVISLSPLIGSIVGWQCSSLITLQKIILVLDAFNLVAIVVAFLWHQRKNRTPESIEIRSGSYILEMSMLTEISEKISSLVQSIPEISHLAQKAALLITECNRLLLYVNKDQKDPIQVDFRLCLDQNECVVTLMDTGIIFDPANRMNSTSLPEEYAHSQNMLQRYSPKSTYTRVMNLNISHIMIDTLKIKVVE